MFLYFSSYILCLFLGISKGYYNKHNRAFVFLLGLFLCTGFFCGSDWRSYEICYNEINFDNLFYNYFAEPGFYIYMLPFKAFNVDFWDFAVFTKFICFFSIIGTCYDLLNQRMLLAVMYFLPWYGFFLFIDCPMRNMIAVALFCISIKYLLRNKIISYLLLVILAGTFHFSALLFLLLPFFVNKKIPSLVYCILFVLIYIFFSSKSIITNIISFLFGGIPYISAKIEGYIIGESEYAQGRIISLGMIIQILWFLLLILKRKVVENTSNGVFLFNMTILHLLLYRFATTIELFARFQLYTSIFFCITLVLLIGMFKKVINAYVYIVYLFVVSSIAMGKLFNDERYIPYTTYIPYFFQRDYPSFEYRSSYNYENSPYK